ncbi:MAG: hypothetical protein OEZ34_03125 [Spirochaetia bacterium]|nr:hypothetical protein [Spirochaetia bacterium]
MPKRMLKKRFNLYMNLIVFPIVLSGLFFVIFPEPSLQFLFTEVRVDSNPLLFFTRIFFLTQIILGITIMSTKDNPGKSRNLIFFIAAYLLSLSAFFLAGIYFYNLKSLASLPGIFLLLSGGFLLAYASRNILVRE